MFAPACHIKSACICVYLRFRKAKTCFYTDTTAHIDSNDFHRAYPCLIPGAARGCEPGVENIIRVLFHCFSSSPAPCQDQCADREYYWKERRLLHRSSRRGGGRFRRGEGAGVLLRELGK